jgi:hypothetical protein
MNLDKIVGVVTLILMLTALSVVLSKKANTVPVVNAVVGGLQKLQATAISPVTG